MRGARRRQEIPNGRLVGQIQFGVRAHQEIGVSPAFERPERPRTPRGRDGPPHRSCDTSGFSVTLRYSWGL